MEKRFSGDNSDSEGTYYAPDERLIADGAPTPGIRNSKWRRVGKYVVTLSWVFSNILSASLGGLATSHFAAKSQLDIGGDIQNIIPHSTSVKSLRQLKGQADISSIKSQLKLLHSHDHSVLTRSKEKNWIITIGRNHLTIGTRRMGVAGLQLISPIISTTRALDRQLSIRHILIRHMLQHIRISFIVGIPTSIIALQAHSTDVLE